MKTEKTKEIEYALIEKHCGKTFTGNYGAIMA